MGSSGEIAPHCASRPELTQRVTPFSLEKILFKYIAACMTNAPRHETWSTSHFRINPWLTIIWELWPKYLLPCFISMQIKGEIKISRRALIFCMLSIFDTLSKPFLLTFIITLHRRHVDDPKLQWASIKTRGLTFQRTFTHTTRAS